VSGFSPTLVEFCKIFCLDYHFLFHFWPQQRLNSKIFPCCATFVWTMHLAFLKKSPVLSRFPSSIFSKFDEICPDQDLSSALINQGPVLAIGLLHLMQLPSLRYLSVYVKFFLGRILDLALHQKSSTPLKLKLKLKLNSDSQSWHCAGAQQQRRQPSDVPAWLDLKATALAWLWLRPWPEAIKFIVILYKIIIKMNSPAHWNAWPGSQDKSYFLI